MRDATVFSIPASDMNRAITAIESESGRMVALEAPIGLQAEDILAPMVSAQVARLWVEFASVVDSGRKVRKLREAMGLTQAEFAALWGSTQANISVMESRDSKLQSRSRQKLGMVVRNQATLRSQ